MHAAVLPVSHALSSQPLAACNLCAPHSNLTDTRAVLARCPSKGLETCGGKTLGGARQAGGQTQCAGCVRDFAKVMTPSLCL